MQPHVVLPLCRDTTPQYPPKLGQAGTLVGMEHTMIRVVIAAAIRATKVMELVVTISGVEVLGLITFPEDMVIIVRNRGATTVSRH